MAISLLNGALRRRDEGIKHDISALQSIVVR